VVPPQLTKFRLSAAWVAWQARVSRLADSTAVTRLLNSMVTPSLLLLFEAGLVVRPPIVFGELLSLCVAWPSCDCRFGLKIQGLRDIILWYSKLLARGMGDRPSLCCPQNDTAL
jgi:hypothetical protein